MKTRAFALQTLAMAATALTACSVAVPRAPAPSATDHRAENNESDRSFVDEMIAHNEQLIEVAQMLISRDDVSLSLLRFGQELVAGLSAELLRLEELPSSRITDFTVADHGAVTASDLVSLHAGSASIADFEEVLTRQFQSASALAAEELLMGVDPEVLQLARQVQAARIAWLREVGTESVNA